MNIEAYTFNDDSRIFGTLRTAQFFHKSAQPCLVSSVASNLGVVVEHVGSVPPTSVTIVWNYLVDTPGSLRQLAVRNSGPVVAAEIIGDRVNSCH